MSRRSQYAPGDYGQQPSNIAHGLLDPALTIGGGLLGSTVGGLMALPVWALEGPDKAQMMLETVQDRARYTPTNEAGIESTGAILDTLGTIGRPFEALAETTGDAAFNATGSPALGALGYMGPDLLGAAIGLPYALKAGRKLNQATNHLRVDPKPMPITPFSREQGIIAGGKTGGLLSPENKIRRSKNKLSAQERLDKKAKTQALRDEANKNRFGDDSQPKGLLDTDYRGAHKAASIEQGTSLDDLSNIYPDDVYSGNGLRYYGSGDPNDAATLKIMGELRGNPEDMVTIYRSVPKGVKEINPGDWVSLSKGYAKSHGDSWVDGGNYDIVSKKVKAKDLFTQGDSLQEWGYNPE